MSSTSDVDHFSKATNILFEFLASASSDEFSPAVIFDKTSELDDIERLRRAKDVLDWRARYAIDCAKILDKIIVNNVDKKYLSPRESVILQYITALTLLDKHTEIDGKSVKLPLKLVLTILQQCADFVVTTGRDDILAIAKRRVEEAHDNRDGVLQADWDTKRRVALTLHERQKLYGSSHSFITAEEIEARLAKAYPPIRFVPTWSTTIFNSNFALEIINEPQKCPLFSLLNSLVVTEREINKDDEIEAKENDNVDKTVSQIEREAQKDAEREAEALQLIEATRAIEREAEAKKDAEKQAEQDAIEAEAKKDAEKQAEQDAIESTLARERQILQQIDENLQAAKERGDKEAATDKWEAIKRKMKVMSDNWIEGTTITSEIESTEDIILKLRLYLQESECDIFLEVIEDSKKNNYRELTDALKLLLLQSVDKNGLMEIVFALKSKRRLTNQQKRFFRKNFSHFTHHPIDEPNELAVETGIKKYSGYIANLRRNMQSRFQQWMNAQTGNLPKQLDSSLLGRFISACVLSSPYNSSELQLVLDILEHEECSDVDLIFMHVAGVSSTRLGISNDEITPELITECLGMYMHLYSLERFRLLPNDLEDIATPLLPKRGLTGYLEDVGEAWDYVTLLDLKMGVDRAFEALLVFRDNKTN